MGSVVVIVVGIIIVVDPIPPDHIVDVAVAIVVDTILIASVLQQIAGIDPSVII